MSKTRPRSDRHYRFYGFYVILLFVRSVDGRSRFGRYQIIILIETDFVGKIEKLIRPYLFIGR